jgi:hypothetical protein
MIWTVSSLCVRCRNVSESFSSLLRLALAFDVWVKAQSEERRAQAISEATMSVLMVFIFG